MIVFNIVQSKTVFPSRNKRKYVSRSFWHATLKHNPLTSYDIIKLFGVLVTVLVSYTSRCSVVGDKIFVRVKSKQLSSENKHFATALENSVEKYRFVHVKVFGFNFRAVHTVYSKIISKINQFESHSVSLEISSITCGQKRLFLQEYFITVKCLEGDSEYVLLLCKSSYRSKETGQWNTRNFQRFDNNIQ